MKDRNKSILLAVKLFLGNEKAYVSDVAHMMGFSESGIRKYLKDEYVKEALGEEVTEQIKMKLQNNIKRGHKEGAMNYVRYNEPTFNENGKLTGSKPRLVKRRCSNG